MVFDYLFSGSDSNFSKKNSIFISIYLVVDEKNEEQYKKKKRNTKKNKKKMKEFLKNFSSWFLID